MPFVFSWVLVAQALVFCAAFSGSLFALFALFAMPLYCLFFFDLRILTTHIAFSIFSQYDKVSNRNTCLYDDHNY